MHRFESEFYFIENTTEGYWIVNKLTLVREVKVGHLHQAISTIQRLDNHLLATVSGGQDSELEDTTEESVH